MDEANLKSAADLAKHRKAAFPNESAEYAEAREKLLAQEIEFRRQMTRLAEQRQALPPGPLIEKDYRFRDAAGTDLGLIDLFGDDETLITYFWMFGPQRDRPCPMCTNWLGSVDGNASDVKQRAALKILGRSPVARQQAFADERGWRNLDFVETVGDDYAHDLGVLTPEGDEYPALVVYQRDGDAVRAFYSAEMPAEAADPGQDPRTAPDIASLWNLLDLTPEGRGTDWYPKLSYERD
ncbi:DUF899 family protein [Novosphingobium kaempferiae]|uniref:DUF899 family protein n=1 Tax=Novosphingobium kaempferiae TaxID=2896849 RepID=UPI001E3DAA23|nr:DUF899 family protein [Novosphingobium kaempferiae]